MSLRIKLLLFFSVILTAVIALLSVNSYMAQKKNDQMTRLLWIHHQYSSLLNLKIAVTLQMQEAQEIFVYEKKAELQAFQTTTELVKKEVSDLVAAETKEGAVNPQATDSTLESQQEKTRLVSIQHSYEDLYREIVLLTRLMKVGRKAKAGEYFKKEIQGRFQNFFGQIDQWIAADEKKMIQVEAAFVLLSNRHNLASVIGLTFILLMVLGSFVLFVSLLGPRMKELYLGTQRIADGDFSKPVKESGNDEFSNFGRAMNQMMVSLADSRKNLFEQSYYSGMADMVSGVLHNVKNSLVPVLVDIEKLESGCQNISAEKITLAAKKLSQPSMVEDKRQDYLEYITLASNRIDEQTLSFQKSLSFIKTKIVLIEKVLNEHNKFSTAERPIEHIAITELIKDSMALVRSDYMEIADIDLDFEVDQGFRLSTQRIVFIQVLSNLIINAVESISRSGQRRGLVQVTVKKEQDGVHIRVVDNGEGISSDRLTEIFQRGVSSKAGSFGLGLHWCANAVASLNGKLYAESEGQDSGAVFHLIL